MFFMVGNTGTTDAVTRTSFLSTRAVDVVMWTMGHGGYGLVRLSAPNWRQGTTFFAHMQFFLHICSKNDDLWLYPRKFLQADCREPAV